MKKTIVFLALMGLVLSCSSDSDGYKSSGNLIDYVQGNWVIKDIITGDGSKVAYINSCSTQKDFIKFDIFRLELHSFNTNCIDQNDFVCNDYFIANGNILVNCNNLVNGIVTRLSANEMQIEYAEIRTFLTGENPNYNTIGVTFVRE